MSISDGFPGRDIDLVFDGTAIGGVREKSFTVNGDPIDVTSEDDDGWRRLLSVAAQRQIDIAVSGITRNNKLKLLALADPEDRVKAASITYPDGSVLTGDFYLSEFKETGPYNDATTFEATLMSTGAVTFTE